MAFAGHVSKACLAAVSTLAFGPGFDLTEAKAALVRAVEGALAEAAAWAEAGRPEVAGG